MYTWFTETEYKFDKVPFKHRLHNQIEVCFFRSNTKEPSLNHINRSNYYVNLTNGKIVQLAWNKLDLQKIKDKLQ